MRKDSLIPSLLGNPTNSNKPGTALVWAGYVPSLHTIENWLRRTPELVGFRSAPPQQLL